MSVKQSRPQTLGALDAAAYPARSVRAEMRRNLIAHLRAGRALFPGIRGYDDTVLPGVIHAILARHDLILLGLRGQAKTRLARGLIDFLDPLLPVIAGLPLREHPLAPLSPAGKSLVAEAGKDTPIEWLEPGQRYGEKLATPDVSIADLIGDIDPLKAAHRGLDLSDEEVIHYGIIPRTNHGIFCINEVPDLAPRIQVGLLNILEEQDIQIRGFPLRLPLDVMMVFTANPEDYTNRGSIITPLKDRIASQVLTHYPSDIQQAAAITADQSWLDRGEDLPQVQITPLFAEIIEGIAFAGRRSEYVDQRSGVSARLSIAARELLASQVERRLMLCEGAAPRARIVDTLQLVPAITGKVELVYEGEQEGSVKVARHLIGESLKAAFDRRFPAPLEHRRGAADEEHGPYSPILRWFAEGRSLELSDHSDERGHELALHAVDGLGALVAQYHPDVDPVSAVELMELAIEGLAQYSLLAKEDSAYGAQYVDMLSNMMQDISGR
ncbi:MAG: magnesium chelatase [Planctomycetota bacterium]|nr:MAG: magnesium chelatase [Planctomycetota bacterium]